MKKLLFITFLIVLSSGCQQEDELILADDLPISTRTPTVTTNAVTEPTSQTCTTGGNVSTSGGGSQTSEKGICYSTSPNPTIANPKVIGGSGSGPFVCIMNGLASSTTYYIKAYAIRKGVVTYGSQVTVQTLVDYGTISDFDGNVYNTITIGTQVWMMENLKTTHYRDGTVVPFIADDMSWFNQTTGAYCHYNNDSSIATTYGKLYNWYAATDAHNIAPTGWHVASLAEWDVLRNYLGGLNIAGGKAKETGTSHWSSPNLGASNSSGFNSIPGGARFVNLNYPNQGLPDGYIGIGQHSDWWTTTTSGSNASFVETNYNSTQMYRSSFVGGVGYYDKRTGYSIRCVKD